MHGLEQWHERCKILLRRKSQKKIQKSLSQKRKILNQSLSLALVTASASKAQAARRKKQQVDRKRRSEAKHNQDLTDEEVDYWRRGSLQSGDRLELGGSRRGTDARLAKRRRKGSFRRIGKILYNGVIWNPILVLADDHVKEHLWPTAWLCAIDELRRTMALARLTYYILLLPLSIGITFWDQPSDVVVELLKFASYPFLLVLVCFLRAVFAILDYLEARFTVLARNWTATLVEHRLWPTAFMRVLGRGVRLVDFTVREMPARLAWSVLVHTAEYWVQITTHTMGVAMVIAAWGLFWPLYVVLAMVFILFTLVNFCAHGATMHGIQSKQRPTSPPIPEEDEKEPPKVEPSEEEELSVQPDTAGSKVEEFREAWLWICRNNLLQLTDDPVATDWGRIRPRLVEVPGHLVDQAIDLLIEGENRLDVLQNLLRDEEVGTEAQSQELGDEQDGSQLQDLFEHYIPPPTWVDPLDQCARSINDDPSRATRMPSFMGRFRRAWTHWMHEFAPDLAQDDLEVKWLAMVHYLDDLERRSRNIVLYMLRLFEGHENLDEEQKRQEIFNVLWEREPPALSPRATRRNSAASQRSATERPPTPERHESDSQLERAINTALGGSGSTSISGGGVAIQSLTNGVAPESGEEEGCPEPEDALTTQSGQNDDTEEPMPQVAAVEEESYSGFLGPVEESGSSTSSESHFPSFSIDWSLRDAEQEPPSKDMRSPQPKRISTNLVDILDTALEKSRKGNSSHSDAEILGINAEQLAQSREGTYPKVNTLRPPNNAKFVAADDRRPRLWVSADQADCLLGRGNETSLGSSTRNDASEITSADAEQNERHSSPDAHARDAADIIPTPNNTEPCPGPILRFHASANDNPPPGHDFSRPTAWSSKNPWGKRSKIPNKPGTFCGWVSYILGFAACGLCAIIQVVASRKQPGVSPETLRNPTSQTAEVSEMQPLVGNELRQPRHRSKSQPLETVDEGQLDEVEEIEGVELSGEEEIQMSGAMPAEPVNPTNNRGAELALVTTPRAERLVLPDKSPFSPNSTAGVRSMRRDGPSDSPTPRRSGEPVPSGNDPVSAFSDSSDEVSRPTRIIRFARRRKNKVKTPRWKKRQESVEGQGSLGVDHAWSGSASEGDLSRPGSGEVKGPIEAAPATSGHGLGATPSAILNASGDQRPGVEPHTGGNLSVSAQSATAKGKQRAPKGEDPLLLPEESISAESDGLRSRETVDEYFLPSDRHRAKAQAAQAHEVDGSSLIYSEQMPDIERRAVNDGTLDRVVEPATSNSKAVEDPCSLDSSEEVDSEPSRQPSPALGADLPSTHVRLPDFPTQAQAKTSKPKAFADFNGPPPDTEVRDYAYVRPSVAHALEPECGEGNDVPSLKLDGKDTGDAGEDSVEQRGSAPVVDDIHSDPPGSRCSPS